MALLTATILAAGCGEGGLPARAPVSGRVTFQGQPLANAQVTFTPIGEEAARPATGRTDDQGRYVLGTYTVDDGAMLGQHRVSVIARGPDRPPKPGEFGSGMPGEQMPGDSLIPVKFFSPDSSGLTKEVVNGANKIDLPLGP
jgi:hypothetical protein